MGEILLTDLFENNIRYGEKLSFTLKSSSIEKKALYSDSNITLVNDLKKLNPPETLSKNFNTKPPKIAPLPSSNELKLRKPALKNKPAKNIGKNYGQLSKTPLKSSSESENI